ncbi:thiamine-phosphate kinase [Terriglobus albidus]|uniref:thiamine-phosphate kinase n=1 Tax=Terriglobus albidus TaxID=1592106 RepID=UPI0021DFFB68|nr:thiamine-phosphate kinase [Terriglobus albidus]
MPYGELDLIREIRRKSLRNSEFVRFGIGDDAAVLRPRKGEDLVITTDFSLEDVHFADFHPPFAAGYRCLARGLSDVAAMGGRPLAAFLSLALSPAWAEDRTKTREFLRGLHVVADQFGVVLAGGDTAGAPGKHTVADIIVVGAVPWGKALLRSGARPGDGIYVTGRLGGAASEFEALLANPEAFRRAKPDGMHPHLFPQPRIAVGLRLLRLASACMDVSDGLSTDLHHLCEASGVGARIHADVVPLAPHSTLDQALHGGEDYELLFTSRRSVPRRISGVEVTKIGIVTEGKKVSLVQNGHERRLRPGGWQHLISQNR